MKLSFRKIYKELRRLDKLQEKRHPMFEKNKFAKFLIYFMFFYYAALLIFMGVVLPAGLDGSMASFHVLDSGFFYILFADFWARFLLQQTPAQQIKPLAVLPLKRKTVLDVYLIRAGLTWGNLFMFFFLVPFAFMSIFPYYGWTGTLGWLFGWWLLLVADSYWYLFCRALIIKNMLWIILPIVVDVAIILATILPEKNILGDFFTDWLEQFIFWNPLAYLIPIVLIIILYFANHKLQAEIAYNEVAKTEEKEMKHASEFKALNRFGIMGEYLKLEIRMRTRNKNVRMGFLVGIGLIVMFSIAVSFSDVYDGAFMQNFICLYNYLILGIMTLQSIMAFEGNYIDGLMSRHESIYDLLRAKYLFNLAMLILPFILMIPTIVAGKISLLMNLGYMFMVAGLIFPGLFQMAVYNSETMPLNTKMTSKTNNWVQQVVSLAVLFVPILLTQLCEVFLGDVWGYVVLIILGSIGIATYPIWLRNIYRRFMERRHKNMEGFRASRATN